MKISVRAKPGSSRQRVVKTGDSSFDIWVVEPPAKGLANLAIKNALSDYFKIPHSQVRLIKGFASKNKVFELED